MTRTRLIASTVVAVAMSLPLAGRAQVLPAPADVITIDASVNTDVAPDLAVVTLAIVREGPDVAAMTRDVNETLAKAFAEAKAVSGVVAANAGYSTFPRFDSRGGNSTRNGWQVRAEILLKSKDFSALGTLVGKLSESMQISGSRFEISPELRTQEEATLLDRGARAFQAKAAATAKSFGYGGYAIREITIGSANQTGNPRVFAMSSSVAEMKSAAPLPMESGRVTLTLTVNGSLQMRK